MHFIYFLGRFHVLALHLPITLILVVAALSWLNRGGRRPDLQPALRILWAATAITAVGTVILGYMHFSEGSFTGSSASAHRALGTSVGVVSLIGWWLQSRHQRWGHARAVVTGLLVLLVVVTGHFGGNLSHGDTYLVEYGPNWVRHLAGLESARPAVTSVADADPYLDVVRPIFSEHCFSCHSAATHKGGLDLSNYAGVLKGGEDGAVIVKGNAGASDMIRRVSLSPGNDDFMPKQGKPPLTQDQIGILRWWIDSGARTGVKMASMQVPADVSALVMGQLRLGVGSSPGSSAPAPPAELANGAVGKKADPALLASLISDGFMARQVSMSDPQLIVTPSAPGASFTTTQTEALVKSAAKQVSQLDLSQSALDDAAAAPIAHLTGLVELKLNGNNLTDKAVQMFGGLNRLHVLSLYGNPQITDASLSVIMGMKSLKKVYLWQTAVTPAGVGRLRAARPDMTIDVGDGGGASGVTVPPQTAATATK